MTVAASSSTAASGRRWRFRFSLAALMLVVTLTGMTLSFWSTAIAPYVRQYEAMMRLATIQGQPGETLTSGPFGPEIVYGPALPAWLGWIPSSHRLVRVTCVRLDHCKVTDRAIECLRELRDLERLYLSATDVGDPTLKLVATLPKVKRLSLWRTKITDRGIGYLSRMSSLEALDIHQTAATEECLKSLQKVPQLAFLRHDIAVSDRGIACLTRFPRLEPGGSVNVRLQNVSDQGLAHLDLYHGAIRLSADNCRAEAGWKRLSSLRSLATIELKDMDIGPALSRVLKELPALKHLKVEGTTIAGCCPASAPRLPGTAGSVGASDSQRPSEGLQALSELPSTTQIELSNCPGVSLEQLGRVWGAKADSVEVAATFCRLRGLSIATVKAELTPHDAVVPGVVHFTNAKSLHFHWSARTSELAAAIRLPQLVRLELYCPMNDETIEHVSRAVGVQSLRIINPIGAAHAGPAISSDGLSRLGLLQQLRELVMQGVAGSDEHWAFLSRLSQLRHLEILAGNRLTDEGLRYVASLRNLEVLALGPATVTDEGPRQLEESKQLKRVSIGSSGVTDAGVKRLRQALPRCSVYYWRPTRVSPGASKGLPLLRVGLNA